MCEWLNLTLNVVTLSHENILKRLYCLNVLTEVSGSGLLLTLIVHCNNTLAVDDFTSGYLLRQTGFSAWSFS